MGQRQGTERLLGQLSHLADGIRADEAKAMAKRVRRLAIWQDLTARGVSRSTIAEASKLTEKAVTYALGEERKRQARASDTG